MDKFIAIAEKIGEILHWITGFIVHPSEGGCCYNKNDDLKKDN